MPDLVPVYAALRTVIEPFAAKLERAVDTGLELHVNTRHVMKNGKPLFFGAVQLRKSLCQLPSHAGLHSAVATRFGVAHVEEANARKVVLQFHGLESALFEELASLAALGYASYQEQGFV